MNSINFILATCGIPIKICVQYVTYNGIMKSECINSATLQGLPSFTLNATRLVSVNVSVPCDFIVNTIMGNKKHHNTYMIYTPRYGVTNISIIVKGEYCKYYKNNIYFKPIIPILESPEYIYNYYDYNRKDQNHNGVPDNIESGVYYY